VVTEPAHRLCLASDPGEARSVEAVGRNEGERDLTIEAGVIREEDSLLCAFAEESFDLIAAGGDARRVGADAAVRDGRKRG
jgi:hypothetical protein